MQADLHFANVVAYNVTKFDVLIGQQFQVRLSPEAVGTAKWFADNDDALRIVVRDGGAVADVTATGEGDSQIQIQSPEGEALLKLNAHVFANEAATLGLSAGSAEMK